MQYSNSLILVLIATIINSIVFGYVASNSKNNKTNQAYLIFLSLIVLYNIFDCIVIQIFEDIQIKNIIVKIQALLWMPLPIIFLNFIYIFLKRNKDQIFHIFFISTVITLFFTLFSDNVLLGYKGFNLGTMAYTGPWFLWVTFFGLVPPAVYALILIGKEGSVFNTSKSEKIINKDSLLSLQLKILFFGSFVCFLVAIMTNIFFDEVLGYNGELHLASLSLSIHTICILPALIKYNFLNQPIEKLGDELYANSSDAVIITNNDGIIVNLNYAARKLFNLRGKIKNKNIDTLFIDKNILMDKDGVEVKIKNNKHVLISQTKISQGTLTVGRILTIRDITSRKLAQESYENLVKTSGDIIYNLDFKGRFTYVNPIFEKITGYDKSEVLGKQSNFMVHDLDKGKMFDTFKKLYLQKSTNQSKSTKIELLIFTKTQTELWMELGVSTMVEKEKVAGFSIIARDITGRKRAEEKLLNITKELSTAQEVAGLGSFTFDLLKNKVAWSDKLYEIYELDKKSFHPTKDNFFNEVVHPDSKEFAINVVEEALQYKKREIDYIHKTNTQTGLEKWMHAIIKITYDDNNNPIFMNGTAQDITEIYTMRLNLEKSEERLIKAQEIAQLGTWEINHETGALYCSAILKKLFEINHNIEVNATMFWNKVHPEDYDWLQKEWKKAEKNKKPYSGTFRIVLSTGEERHFNQQAEFITNKKGKVIKTVGTLLDMTELHKHQEALRELSSHIQDVQEKERGKIAREIHDELGQRLTAINMDISFLKNKLEDNTPKPIKERLFALNKLVDETINMSRRLSQELRPTILDDLGLIAAIDWLKEQYNARTDIQFTLDLPKNEPNLSSEYATAIFRITQEALTNIIRHSEAENVNIKIKNNDSNIMVEVTDDGKGISKQNIIEKGKTFGVFGMQERASSLGGMLKINKNNKKGTTVNLTLPYKNIISSYD